MKIFEFMFYRKRVSLVSCLLSFLFWLTLSPRLFSVPPEESRELSLFPVLIKVTCSLPRSPQGPTGTRQQQTWGKGRTPVWDRRREGEDYQLRCFLSIRQQ